MKFYLDFSLSIQLLIAGQVNYGKKESAMSNAELLISSSSGKTHSSSSGNSLSASGRVTPDNLNRAAPSAARGFGRGSSSVRGRGSQLASQSGLFINRNTLNLSGGSGGSKSSIPGKSTGDQEAHFHDQEKNIVYLDPSLAMKKILSLQDQFMNYIILVSEHFKLISSDRFFLYYE